ncbi:MAG: hypothetical protein NVSMB9_02090 [Isosphaeraceae bacterium]
MRFNRRQSDSARNRLGSSLETLEGRVLLSRDTYRLFSQYAPGDLSVYNPITHEPSPYSVKHQLLSNPGTQNSLLGNEGKIVSGKNRQGDEWTITVHGPGTVIVTDTTPNDGSLNDSIDTIQLINTDINQTYVTGSVVGSFRVPTAGTVDFNRLIATTGVRSVILNGFNLNQTIAPLRGPNNLNTGVYLLGGVRELSFHDILAPVDRATRDAAVNVVIGDPSTPLQVEPKIHVDHIFTTVFNSLTVGVPANVPVTTPSVNIIVNGGIRSLDFISTTQQTIAPSQQFQFSPVATTGRTAVQATSIYTLNVAGAATNFTASRSSAPFANGFSGLSRLHKAHFRGPTDAVGLDVNGPIDILQYDKGISNPTNLFLGTTSTGAQVPATSYGIPADQTSFAGAGLVGGQVTATRIGSLTVRPANTVYQIPSNPDFVQIFRQGNTAYIPRPGNALTNALIVSSGDIGRVHIKGDAVNSEIKSGFHYPSYAAGLEGTRAPSRISRLRHEGNLTNSVTSATYRPYLHYYGTPADQAGPGSIRGNFRGIVSNTRGITSLGNVGAGFYARSKRGGYLPPPVLPNRVNGILVR